jgi:lysozyme
MEAETERKAIDRATRLIKKFEGYRANAYQDSAGVWTIGYGTTAGVYPGQTTDREEAEQRLRQDIEVIALNPIKMYVTAPLNADQLAALISFVYNVGPGAFANSTLLQKLNARQYDEAAQEFPRWNKAGGEVLRGLIKRRAAEQALFNGTEKKSEFCG